MASKRPAPHVHPSRQDQVPAEPRRKRQKPNNAGPKSFKKAHPVNDLKSEVRSLKRLLERDLPADVRVEKERALQTAENELQKTQKAKQRSDIISRYHKVRFFDKQKAEKRLKRARKLLKDCEDSDERRPQREQQVKDGETAVNYAQYYPLEVPYVSLFPRKNECEQDEDEGDGQKDNLFPARQQANGEMWERVKQCMKDDTLDALRNGKLTPQQESKHGSSMSSGVRERKKAAGLKSEREELKVYDDTRLPRAAENDNESDGGFFE